MNITLTLDFSTIFMITGFMLAAYSCVANDVIQTLGTFLSSNEKKPALMIWVYVSVIFTATIIFGWLVNNGELSFNRLDEIPHPEIFHWYHVLPPIALLILTRFGMPVSTTFLLLMVFSPVTVIENMVFKSVCGYIVAFLSAIVLYTFIAKKIEKHFIHTKDKQTLGWTIMQWCSTAFLWSQWIMHDVANIFVYLPRKFNVAGLITVLIVFVALLGLICYARGGAIQKIVKEKTNTQDIRSASIIDLIYAFVLVFFKEINTLPMSTTWVFIGILAGREIALYNRLKHASSKKIWSNMGKDFFKVFTGLIVSVFMVYLISMVK